MKFKVTAVDTDGIFFKKETEEPFTEEEQELLLEEMNSIFPEKITWELGGIYPKLLTFKAKNYVMLSDDGKIKYKGSSLKSSTLEIGLREFIDECVRCLLEDRSSEFTSIYNKYVKLLHTIISQEEMKKWCSKKTLTEKVYDSERTNETKILEAIKGAEYSHGDKVWLYFDSDNTLKLIENFNGSYSIEKLLIKLYNCVLRFRDVTDTSRCINYKLKRSKKALEELLNESI